MKWCLASGVVLCCMACTSQPVRRVVHVEPPVAPHGQILFSSGRATLASDQRQAVAKNGEWHRTNPTRVLLLEGHTDDVGSANYNQQLGDRRARNVAAGMVAAGADPTRMAGVVSYGETKPQVPNANAAARKTNRRVEVIAW